MSAALQQGFELIQRGRHDLALPVLRRALSEDPDHAHTHGLIALCLVVQNQTHKARQAAKQAIALDADDPLGFYALGLSLEFDESIRVVAGAVEEAMSRRRHRLHEAEMCYREALRLSPQDADYHARIGWTLYERERLDEALTQARAGLACAPRSVKCLVLAARVLMHQNKLDEADHLSRLALEVDPEGSSEHLTRGHVLLRQHQPELAAEHFAQALRVDPSVSMAREGFNESLRARFRVYRWLSHTRSWLGKNPTLTAVAFVLLVIGSIALQIAYELHAMALAPIVVPVALYVALTTRALFTLPLMRHPVARFAVTMSERYRAVLMLAIFVWLAVLGLVTVTGSQPGWLWTLAFGSGALLPLVALLAAVRHRLLRTAVAVGLTAATGWLVAVPFIPPTPDNDPFTVYALVTLFNGSVASAVVLMVCQASGHGET